MKKNKDECKHLKYHWIPFSCSVVCDKCGAEGSCSVSQNPETGMYEIVLNENPEWITKEDN